MCGRFALQEIPKPIVEELSIEKLPAFGPRYNIAPSQEALVIFRPDSSVGYDVRLFTWGFPMLWKQGGSTVRRLPNARVETCAEKPPFRRALKTRRCLVPASGFFEWQKEGEKKQAYYITPNDGIGFAFAGLWEASENDRDEKSGAFTILTTDSKGVMTRIHHRMPVIVPVSLMRPWLDPNTGDLGMVIKSLSDQSEPSLKTIKVSSFVNNPKNEGVRCIEEI